MPIDQTEFAEGPFGRIAFRTSPGDPGRTGLVWLGGYHSDMKGEKAEALHRAAEAAGRSFLRFDYSGHGESDGAFEDGTVSRWRADALFAIQERTSGPLVLVGSSMGAWMSLLVALAPELSARVRALTLLATAPDFTERLMWARFSDAQKREILDQGYWTRPSPYDPAGYRVTRALIEDGRKWLLLDSRIAFAGPVRLLHGDHDADVPPDHSRLLVDCLVSDDVRWTLVKGGDHRLSRPSDIDLMTATALELAAGADAKR